MKRAALYLRVSTVDQHPETQLYDLRQMAAQRGHEIAKEYTDRISGVKARRPGLDEMMRDARRGHFDVVLVWACDRIARSTRHFLEVLDEFNHLGIEFVGFRDRKDKIYYLAGTYFEPLRFTFSDGAKDITISGEPVDLEGNPIPIGGEWKGLHHGVRYTLAAGGSDIYYTCFPRPDVKRLVKLSKEVGADSALQVASRVKAIKGFQGGRFYVNEWREMFAPRLEDDETQYFYIGKLQSDDPWFRVRRSSLVSRTPAVC